jgi:hypothetical protein
LDFIQQGRVQWDALLAQVSEERMTQPGITGDWSVKDIIAHVSWHEREMVGVLRSHALLGSELWNLPQDQRNAQIFEENKQRSLEDVRTEASGIFLELCEGAEALEEEDLTDPGRFPGTPSEWQPWQLIANNTYEHYQQHMPDVRAWLEGSEERS